MITFRQTRQLGFTLAEIMVAVVVLAVLLGVAIPGFKTWMLNAKIRTVAESALVGLQRARTEAVTRNAKVEFVLGADQVSWSVNMLGGTSNPIDAGPGAEAASGVLGLYGKVTPASATRVTFDMLGTVTANSDASNALSEVLFDYESSVLRADLSHELRIKIGMGGSSRMCDPNAAASSPSAC